MKNKLICLILVLFMAGCSVNTGASSALTSNDNDTANDMKVYDLDGVKSFIEHGTGVVLLEGTDENSKKAEEMVRKAADEEDVTPSFYKVEDEGNEELIYLINSHNVSRVKMLGDAVVTPLLLFVEDGMIQTYYMADDFAGDELSAMLTESMAELADYMKANNKDACDSGCKLG